MSKSGKKDGHPIFSIMKNTIQRYILTYKQVKRSFLGQAQTCNFWLPQLFSCMRDFHRVKREPADLQLTIAATAYVLGISMHQS